VIIESVSAFVRTETHVSQLASTSTQRVASSSGSAASSQIGWLAFSVCMRSHGVPNWPDPTLNSEEMPVFNVTQVGIDRQFIHSSLFRTANGECERLTGAPVPRQ
jgi:hypothetical protein